MTMSFVQPGLVLTQDGGGPSDPVKDLQRALRSLGYLSGGIDGKYQKGTAGAVSALQYDLLHNDGKGSDGQAPVAVTSYNKGRVAAVNGVCDQNLAQCIVDILDDRAFVRLPLADNAGSANQSVRAKVGALKSTSVPTRFIVAILKQESDLRHYNEADSYVYVGLDRNNEGTPQVTSRGYGIGQFTIFHHPPRPDEVSDFMDDPVKNVSKAQNELRDKFDHFVLGNSGASDRAAEIGTGPLRICKYAANDPKYLTDCRQCCIDAGSRDINPGDPYYAGATGTMQPTQYYASAEYKNIPKRESIGCDWPYAVRRYNGGGVNSYHYQARVLRNVRDVVL
ncbi:MAG: putative peptidoglycan binding domain [Thermoanaerobaculia bacterium]|jgi:peptidoglycan hydrolase-like protein with peptidoglycan-binding domain|nr:putative peptidoglycan binding domain [Thermoanaerobaculia bacterium]